MTTTDALTEQDVTERGWKIRVRSTLKSDFVRALPYWGIPFSLVGIAVYGGIAWNIVLSLTDFSGLGSPSYSGLDLDLYVQALTSSGFQNAAKNTLVLLVVFTLACLVLGLFLALVIDQVYRFEQGFQTIYLLPMSLSFVVTAQLWLWMYDFNSGVINIILGGIGLPRIHWIGNLRLTLFAVIFAMIWQFSGYAMVVFLAGLRSIPDSQFEAAMIDGSSTVRTYARVIIPQLKTSAFSATVVLMIFALKLFDFLYTMFGGFRPPQSTDILATLMVREAFQYAHWAYAAAIATLLLIMSLGVITPYIVYQYRQGDL
jgi:glucose/mannose transport system permease protein